MKHLLAAVIVAFLIVLWYVWQPAKAAGECLLWAQTVELLEQTDTEDQRAQLAEWLAATKGNTEAQRAIMRAVNWHESGQTSAAAWKECTSI